MGREKQEETTTSLTERNPEKKDVFQASNLPKWSLTLMNTSTTTSTMTSICFLGEVAREDPRKRPV